MLLELRGAPPRTPRSALQVPHCGDSCGVEDEPGEGVGGPVVPGWRVVTHRNRHSCLKMSQRPPSTA